LSALAFAALLLSAPLHAGEPETPPLPTKQFTSAEKKAIAAYRAQFAEYRRRRDAYERDADRYWDSIAEKRAERREKRAAGKPVVLTDYVLDQPPVYSGPPAPRPPASLVHPTPPKKKPPQRGLPVVADFLKHAKKQFSFVPERPAGEMDYKRAYARAAIAAGLTKEQVTRIYGFEAGGNGEYDVQAGLESKKPGRKPISTALGYNQLLIANTMGLLASHGAAFIDVLEDRAENSAKAVKQRLKAKIAKLRRMVHFARSVPYKWSTHVKMSSTAKGIGLHAANLDIDIGPLLQTQKLVNSLDHARNHAHKAPLTAAELEMMNLTGDGNGFDMVTIPNAMRDKIPTANFFERGGYERNPVAIRNNVVSALLAATDRRMDNQMSLDGSKAMASAFEEVMRSQASAGATPIGASQ
jgi:hypothetical protein